MDSYTSVNEFYSFIILNLLINAVILLLNCHYFNTLSLHLFSPLKNYWDLHKFDTVSSFLIFVHFTSSVSHGVENYFPALWDTGFSDTIFCDFKFYVLFLHQYMDKNNIFRLKVSFRYILEELYIMHGN